MTDADTHTYYDISIFNNDTSGDMPVQLKFTEQRSGGALVDNPSDYYLSIVRFEIDSPSLPIFIPQARLGTLNDLIYSFGIETISTSNAPTTRFKKRIQYTPINPNITEPNPSNENFSHKYYYISNVRQWLRMVNTCLQEVFDAMRASDSNGDDTLITTNSFASAKAPFFDYNSSSGLITLYTTTQFFDTPDTARLRLFWNTPVNTLFGGFDVSVAPIATSLLFDSTAPAEGVASVSHPSTYYQVNITNPNNKNTITFGSSSTAFIQSTQTYPSMPMCSPIQNIVFSTSGNLPVSNSQIGNPTIFKSDGDCATQGGADNISPILTDFIVPLIRGDEYKPKINYSPSEYRLLDMKGNAPLKSCDLQVYWKSKIDAKLHPFILGSQCGASCKIMFRRKQFNNIY
jgi:hypothetical protein